MAKTSAKIKVPIILMAWPLAGILFGLLVYMIVNFVVAGSGADAGLDVLTTVINIVLFVISAGSIVFGIPSLIVGLVLLILRLTPKSSTGIGLGVAGMVLGITSILSSFLLVGLAIGVVGICLSAAALKRRSAGKGMAIAGLATSIVGVFISLIFCLVVIVAAIATYDGTNDAAKSAAVRSDAIRVSSAVESLYATNAEYPTYIELVSDLSRGIMAGVNNGDLADKVGMYGSLKDIEYIPCYGDGAMIWYWDFEVEKYMAFNYGDTTSCQY